MNMFLLETLFFVYCSGADGFMPSSSFLQVAVSRTRFVAEVEEGRTLKDDKEWKTWPSDLNLKVVYGVFSSPLPKYVQQMTAVQESWAKDVAPQKLLVVGVNGSAPGISYELAPQCKDGHVYNTGISCKEATLLSTGYASGADWVVIVGSDNYVFPRHVEEMLDSYDSAKPQMLGVFGCGEGEYCEDQKSGACGGAGYAISRGALKKMVGNGEGAGQKFIEKSMHEAETTGGFWSDQVTSCIARRHGVHQVQVTGMYGWRLCDNDPDFGSCPVDQGVYAEKIKSRNPKTLTLHYIQPDEMYLIYKLAHETTYFLQFKGLIATDLNQTSVASYEKERAAYVSKMNRRMRLGTQAKAVNAPSSRNMLP